MVFLGGMGSQGKMGNKDLPDPLDLMPPLPHAVGGGALYTRWGKSSCPQEGTELVYSGITGGIGHNLRGGGANHLCMPKDPEYSTTLTYRSGVDGHTHIYGAEYGLPIQGTSEHDVPCAVCYVSTRPTAVMIPAKASCPPTWTREYYGYLMTDDKGHYRSTYQCVDEDQESLPYSNGNTNGAVFYHVEATCDNSLPCPPYSVSKEVNCVLCTK